MKMMFRYRVTHPDYGTVEVVTVDRLRAISGAGVIWEVPWTSIARQCSVERLGPAADDDTSSDLADAQPPSPQGEGKTPEKEAPVKKATKKTATKGKSKAKGAD